jgi:hypothetical protein
VESNEDSDDPLAPGWRIDPPGRHSVKLVKTEQSSTSSKAKLDAAFTTPGFKKITIQVKLSFAGVDGNNYFAVANVELQVANVKFEINPIQVGVVADVSPMRFVNPAGIVILDKAVKPENDPDQLALTRANGARIVITKVEPKSFDLDKKVNWSVQGVDLLTGQPAAKGGKALFFDSNKDSLDDAGREQGQLQLNRCSGKDFHEEVVAPAATAALHGDAVLAGMLL